MTSMESSSSLLSGCPDPVNISTTFVETNDQSNTRDDIRSCTDNGMNATNNISSSDDEDERLMFMDSYHKGTGGSNHSNYRNRRLPSSLSNANTPSFAALRHSQQQHQPLSQPQNQQHQKHQQRLLLPSPPPPSPFSITGVLSAHKTVPLLHRSSMSPVPQLHYMVYRPRNLQPLSASAAKNLPKHILDSLQSKPPLICIAGGPGMPSSYFMPVVQTVTDRSIILYDSYGCGKSIPTSILSAHQNTVASSPSHTTDPTTTTNATNATNITNHHHPFFDLNDMVMDFQALMNSLPIQHYHLLGHSLGGIIAYEYLQLLQDPHSWNSRTPSNVRANDSKQRCLSLIMSSTPSSIPEADRHSQKLLRNIQKEVLHKHRVTSKHKNATPTSTAAAEPCLLRADTNHSRQGQEEQLQQQQSESNCSTESLESLPPLQYSAQDTTTVTSSIQDTKSSESNFLTPLDTVTGSLLLPLSVQHLPNITNLPQHEQNTSYDDQDKRTNINSTDNYVDDSATSTSSTEASSETAMTPLQAMIQRAKDKQLQQQQQAAAAEISNEEMIALMNHDQNYNEDDDDITVSISNRRQNASSSEIDDDDDSTYSDVKVQDNEEDLTWARTTTNTKNNHLLSKVYKIYFERHECRAIPIPMALQNSIDGYRTMSLSSFYNTNCTSLKNTNQAKGSVAAIVDVNPSVRQYDVRRRQYQKLQQPHSDQNDWDVLQQHQEDQLMRNKYHGLHGQQSKSVEDTLEANESYVDTNNIQGTKSSEDIKKLQAMPCDQIAMVHQNLDSQTTPSMDHIQNDNYTNKKTTIDSSVGMAALEAIVSDDLQFDRLKRFGRDEDSHFFNSTDSLDSNNDVLYRNVSNAPATVTSTTYANQLSSIVCGPGSDNKDFERTDCSISFADPSTKTTSTPSHNPHTSSLTTTSESVNNATTERVTMTSTTSKEQQNWKCSCSCYILPKAVLLLRGQDDFVTHDNIIRWKNHFPIRRCSCSNSMAKVVVQLVTLSNCSHYAMVEQEELYGTVVSSFLQDHDEYGGKGGNE